MKRTIREAVNVLRHQLAAERVEIANRAPQAFLTSKMAIDLTDAALDELRDAVERGARIEGALLPTAEFLHGEQGEHPCRTPIAAFDKTVVCDDGTAWIWAAVPAKDPDEAMEFELAMMSGRGSSVPHTWRQYHTPIPGTREAWRREHAEDRADG